MITIKVYSINGEEDDELTFCDKCFHFWGEKHPICVLWLFIIFMFSLAIGISEYGKER